MPSAAVALLEQPTTTDPRWVLQRKTDDQWYSIACAPTGWTLSIHGGEFTVIAEGTYKPGQDADGVAALRSRLRALGWNDTPAVRLRPKRDRRRS